MASDVLMTVEYDCLSAVEEVVQGFLLWRLFGYQVVLYSDEVRVPLPRLVCHKKAHNSHTKRNLDFE